MTAGRWLAVGGRGVGGAEASVVGLELADAVEGGLEPLAQRGVGASFVEQGLGFVEEGRVEDGFVGLVDDVAEGDLAELAAVAQDAEHHFGTPGLAGAGA